MSKGNFSPFERDQDPFPILPSSAGGAPLGRKFPFIPIGGNSPGRVVQQMDPQHAFLHLRGQDVFVESHFPLPPGGEYQFRVEEVQPRVVLKLLPPESPEEQKIYALLKRYLAVDVPLENLAEGISGLGKVGFQGIPPSAQESVNQFLTLLHRFSPAELFSADPGALQKLIDQSGFFWENKIKNWIEGGGRDPRQLIQGDLKGLGKELLAQLKGLEEPSRGEAAGRLQSDELKQILEPFLRKVELYQILNLQSADWTDRFNLFLPFWLGSHLQFVELNLSLPRKKSAPSERDELSVLFLLKLPALGKVRIEVQIKEKDLFCRLMVSDSQVSEFLRQALPSLSGRLQQLGYHPHLQLSVEPVEKLNETFVSDLKRGPLDLFNIII